jgi:RHS repeat-associated protein
MNMTRRTSWCIHAARTLAVVVALGGVAWGQVAPSGSHQAAKATDTGFASQVNSTGGFSAAVPLDLPPAKRGLPVPVSVVYGGRRVGAAGMGWDIPLTYIVRDTSYAHRLPFYDDQVTPGTTVPSGVEQLILVMGGVPTRLMRQGNQKTSTTWVPVSDGPQLEVHEDVVHGAMLMYDGDGRTYTFLNTGPVGPPDQPPTGHVPLLDGKLYTLTSITVPGNKVLLEYVNITYPLPGGGTGLEVDLHSVTYNSPTAASTCAHDRIVLTYNVPQAGADGKFVPLSATMIGSGILARVSTLKWIDVHAFNQCSGATDLILRRHTFNYDENAVGGDPDTGVPRLTSVGMSGRSGTPEVQKTISLGKFGYGTASIANGTGRALRYSVKETVLLSTGGHALGESTSTLTDRGTWAELVDLTGDGRPDLVHQIGNGNAFEIAANFPSQGGGTSFSVSNGVPASVLAAPDKPLQREWITNSPADLDVSIPARLGRDQNVWRQLIDVNGDGRVDLIDAREVPGQWVVYLNTPGPTAWEIRWRRMPINVAILKQVLQDHNHAIDDFLPLSRRHTGMEGVTTPLFTCTAPSPSRCSADDVKWVLTANGPNNPASVVQSTYVEWELRDVNGDGYVDVVFNDVGGVNETETVTRPQVAGGGGTTAPGQSTHTVALPVTGIDAVYNLAGPLLSGGENALSSYPFSAPVQILAAGRTVAVSDRATDMPAQWFTLSSPRRCGVGLWVQGQPTGDITPQTRPQFIDLSTQFCGFSDINGDSLVDRIEGITAYLQGGDTSFGAMTVTLPSYMQGGSNDSRVLCCNDHNSTCDGVTQAINFNAYQELALKDINGDGILDYVDQRINRQTLFFSQSVRLGTGSSFGPVLTLQTGDSLHPMLLSYEPPGCPGFFEIADAHTTIGMYDLDGDGKAEMLDSNGTVWALNDGSQADWGRPGAGRLVAIDNGHGALTKITYRSAKEDLIGAHQVPFPEIVAAKVETVKTSDQDSTPLTTETDYAFSSPDMIFDSLRKQWGFGGYRRMITMQRDGSSIGRMTVTDTHSLQPMTTGQNQFDRFLATGKIGRPRDVTMLAGEMTDPWAELGLEPGDTSDPRIIGAAHYDYTLQMLTEPVDSTVTFCREMVDPYDYVVSQQATSTWPVCATHGFTFTSTTSTWRGTTAPPATANVTTTTQVARDTYGRVTSQIHSGDGETTLETALDYATPANAPGSNAPRVLNAVKSRLVFATLLQMDSVETWQYDGDNPDNPNGTVSNGLLTTHTVTRIPDDGGNDLGKVRTTFEWDPTDSPPTGVLTSVSTAREDSAGHADGASRKVSLNNYDEFKLAPRQIQVDTVGVAGAPPIPSLITTFQLDPYTLAVQNSVDPNNTKQGACRDGFDRVYETFEGSSTGTPKITSTISYMGFASGEAGPPQVATKTFIDLNGAQDPCGTSPPALTTPGITSTAYLDELGRPFYTATQLGADYGNQTLITDARIYDRWGRTVYVADAHVASQSMSQNFLQDIAATYGTSSYFQADGTPDCIIRGPASSTGPHALTRVTDESTEVYPTCFTLSFNANLARIDTQGPDSLLGNSPQSGVVYSDIKSVAGRVLNRSTWQNNARLEYADFAYNNLGQLQRLRRYLDPVALTGLTFVAWSWDSLGQPLQMGDAGLAPRERSYSNWGELVEESWTDSTTSPTTIHRITFRYDALGRMVHSEESRQSGTAAPAVDADTINDYIYDAATPLTGGTVDFTPTHLTGRLARAVSPAQTVSLSYDDLGRPNGQAFSDGQLYVETRSYHSDGTLDQLHLLLPDHLEAGHSVNEFATYHYDSMRRLDAVSYADGSTSESLFSGTHDVFGRLTQGQYDATTLTATYAPGGRRLLTSWKVANSTSSQLRQIVPATASGAPAFDPVGRERGRAEGANSLPLFLTQYSYDSLGRLQQTSDSVSSRSFSYDALGNLLRVTREDLSNRPAEVTLSYGALDHDLLTQIAYGNNAPRDVTYDMARNITQMPTTGGGTRTIDYFSNGAVRSVTDDAGNSAHYKYDAFGGVAQLEIDSTSSGNTRHDRHYGSTIGARDEIVGGTLKSVIIRNIPGDRGILAARHGATSTWTFGFGELKGNRFFTDRSANFIQDENYTAFGAPTSSPPAEKRVATYSSAKWNGGDTLEALGVTQLGARLYDPLIGRFLSRDPLIIPRTAATTNPYAFSMNDPINGADPTGLDIDFSDPEADAISAAIAAHLQAEREQQLFETSFNIGVVWTQFRVQFDDQTIANMGLTLGAVKLGAKQWNEFVEWHKVSGLNDFQLFRDFQGELAADRQLRVQVREHPIRTPLVIIATNGGKALAESALVAIPGVGEAGLVERAAVEATFAEPLLAEAAAAERAIATETAAGQGAAAATRIAKGPCFAASTMIHSERGLVPIEEVQVGDRVRSRNEETGDEGYRSVVRTSVTLDQPTLELQFIGGSRETETLEATLAHPFWVVNRGWVAARDLRPGDEVYTSQGGSARISRNVRTERATTVYNLEVEEFHTYFVGDAGLWVHNNSSLTRPITAADLALSRVSLSSLKGTVTNAGSTRILQVEDIAGVIPAGELRGALRTIVDQARSDGVRTLQIAGRFANERLQSLVTRQAAGLGGTISSSDGLDFITFIFGR